MPVSVIWTVRPNRAVEFYTPSRCFGSRIHHHGYFLRRISTAAESEYLSKAISRDAEPTLRLRISTRSSSSGSVVWQRNIRDSFAWIDRPRHAWSVMKIAPAAHACGEQATG